jgi:hypothetical protein
MELFADGRQAVDDQKVIEGVESPAKKTGEYGGILIGRRGPADSGIVNRRLWRLACGQICMIPVDKATEKQKETVEKEEDLRHEWVEEDIKSEGRKPDLEEIEEDESIL